MTNQRDNILLETQNPRRRTTTAVAWSSTSASESSPLELDGTSQHPSHYSTFGQTSNNNDNLPYWWTVLSRVLVGRQTLTFATRPDEHHHRSRRRLLWTVFILFSCILGIYRWHSSPSLDILSASTWEWDYNHYVPRSTRNSNGADTNNPPPAEGRNLLLAQISGATPLNELAEIASRPNRAYARQWGIDYLGFSAGHKSLSRECFTKIYVLDALLAKQQQQGTRSPKEKEDDAQTIQEIQQPKRRYDAVLFLPADAVITDLDFNLLSLLPEDKLVGIASRSSWEGDGGDAMDKYFPNSESDIIIWNLNHEYSRTVSQLWLEYAKHLQTSCQDGNDDLRFLLTAVASVLGDDSVTSLLDLILVMTETDQGFVGGPSRVIKFMPRTRSSSSGQPRVNMLVNNIRQTRASLGTVADSVCYRYYPKCEVI